MLQCVTVSCCVLQCAAVQCSMLQCAAVCVAHRHTREGREVCCSVLQCVAACCSVLQCAAMSCRVRPAQTNRGNWSNHKRCTLSHTDTHTHTHTHTYSARAQKHKHTHTDILSGEVREMPTDATLQHSATHCNTSMGWLRVVVSFKI